MGRQSWTTRSSRTRTVSQGTRIRSTTASSARRMRSLECRHARTHFRRHGVEALGATWTLATATTRLLGFRTTSPPRHPASHCTTRTLHAAAWTRTAVVRAQFLAKLHAGVTLIALGPVVRVVLSRTSWRSRKRLLEDVASARGGYRPWSRTCFARARHSP